MGGVLWGLLSLRVAGKAMKLYTRVMSKAAIERCGLIKLDSNDTTNFGHFKCIFGPSWTEM